MPANFGIFLILDFSIACLDKRKGKYFKIKYNIWLKGFKRVEFCPGVYVKLNVIVKLW